MSRNDRVQEIFSEAIEIESDEERRRFLEAACADDAELRAKVDLLLQAHQEAGSFMRVEDGDATVSSLHLDEHVGTTIGPYKLLEQIGEGGMGVVFRASQSEPVKREVALKIIKPGMDTKEVIARFEAERQALAMMDHPHIAKVLDAGATETGRPFFVMELVKGWPITKFCDREQLDLTQRLNLFRTVCDAIQHAHQKGIIHRDIKPTNVLVSMSDGKPHVKVIDFGVAKALHSRLTDHTLWTSLQQVLGTPLYMSPEQADQASAGVDIDTRTDIYSLGVLLYELLTGTTPFNREMLQQLGIDEIRRIIQTEEPVRPSARISTLGDTLPGVAAVRKLEPKQLTAFVRGDLDWVVMRALEKDRERRYTSASAFADDIERFLHHEPVDAGPPSKVYRCLKFARRNKKTLVAGLLIAIFLVTGIIGTTWQAIRADEERDRAVTAEHLAQDRLKGIFTEKEKTEQALTKARLAEAEQRRLRHEAQSFAEHVQKSALLEKRLRLLSDDKQREANWNLYVAKLYPMQQAFKDRDFGRLEQLLRETTPSTDDSDFRGWEWRLFQDHVHAASHELTTKDGPVLGPVTWNPVADEFAAATGLYVDIWDPRTLQILRRLEPGFVPSRIKWSPCGCYIAASGRRGFLCILDAKSGALILRQRAFPPQNRDLHKEAQDAVDILALTWSPDSSAVAVGNWYGEIGVVRLSNPEFKRIRTPERIHYCGSLDWHPDGEHLLAGLRHGQRALYDLSTGDVAYCTPNSLDVGYAVACNPSGTRFATSEGAQIQILDEHMKHVTHLAGHSGRITELIWIDDSTLCSAGEDHSIRFWNVSTRSSLQNIRIHSTSISYCAVDRTGTQMVSVSKDGARLSKTVMPPEAAIAVIDTATTKQAIGVDPDFDLKGITFLSHLKWSHDGTRLATGGATNRLIECPRLGMPDCIGSYGFWNSTTFRRINVQPIVHLPRGLDWFSNDHTMRITDYFGSDRSYDVGTGLLIDSRLMRPGMKECLSQRSRNKRFVAFLHDSFILEIRDNDTLQLVGHKDLNGICKPTRLAWDHSGNRIAPVGHTGDPVILSTDGKIIVRTPNYVPCHAVDWHPSDRLLAYGMTDGEINVRDTRDLTTLITMRGHKARINDLHWSPDGRRLASASNDGTVRIWDFATGAELLRLTLKNIDSFQAVEWSPDGQQLAATATQGRVVVWGSICMEPLPLTSTILHTGAVAASIRKRQDDDRELISTAPLAGWKKYAKNLYSFFDQPIDDGYESSFENQWRKLIATSITGRNTLKERSNFIKAVYHFVDAHIDEPRGKWLGNNLKQLLAHEANDFPNDAFVIRTLSDLHLLLGSASHNPRSAMHHWRKSIAISRRLAESHPEDQILRSRLAAHLSVLVGMERENGADMSEFDAMAELKRFSSLSCYHQYRLALLQVATGDLAGHRSTCRQMVALCTSSIVPAEMQRAVWASILAPETLDDYTVVIELARQACEQQPDNEESLIGLAAVLMRAAKYSEAKTCFERARELTNPQSRAAGFLHFFLAILEQHLGNQRRASYHIKIANAALSAEPAVSPSWDRKLALQLLQKEAEDLIGIFPASDTDSAPLIAPRPEIAMCEH